MHKHTYIQWFYESCDWAILNMLAIVPECNSVQFACGSLGWQNVHFNQHCFSHKEPLEKCLTLYITLEPNASIFFTYTMMSVLSGDNKK